jgi:hypothetical protein
MVGREVWSASLPMRLRPLHPLSCRPSNRRAHGLPSRQSDGAEQLLGIDHPLAVTTRRAEAAIAQMTAVACTGFLAGVLLIRDLGETGVSLLVAAVLVQTALALRLLGFVRLCDVHSLELIAAGRSRLPLRSVERVRRRMEDPAHRATLARTLDDFASAPSRPLSYRESVLAMDLRNIRAVRPELWKLAALLRCDTAPVRGVAVAELLVTEPGSPLYGHDLRLLREGLRRVSFLLTA